jgi:hypothetical protein
MVRFACFQRKQAKRASELRERAFSAFFESKESKRASEASERRDPGDVSKTHFCLINGFLFLLFLLSKKASQAVY